MADETDEEVRSERIFAWMRKIGADTIQADFNGGGDEGGADSITVYDVAERIMFDATEDTLPPGIDEAEADNLVACVEEILSAHFGGFNGDPYVTGTITFTLETGEIEMTGSSQVWQEFDPITIRPGTEPAEDKEDDTVTQESWDG